MDFLTCLLPINVTRRGIFQDSTRDHFLNRARVHHRGIHLVMVWMQTTIIESSIFENFGFFLYRFR